MPKAIYILLIMVSILSCTTGCVYKDIDKRFFVMAMGIDWTGKPGTPYLITIKLAIPTTKIGEGRAESQVESVEAASVAEAVRNIKARVDKELDFGQCKMFLFGKKLVQHSMDEPLNWLNRRRDMQMVAFMAEAKPSANQLLRSDPKTERIVGNSFFLMFGKEGTVSPYTVTEYVFFDVSAKSVWILICLLFDSTVILMLSNNCPCWIKRGNVSY